MVHFCTDCSTLAETLLGIETPQRWKNTDWPMFHFGWNPFRDWNSPKRGGDRTSRSFHFGWNPFRDWNTGNHFAPVDVRSFRSTLAETLLGIETQAVAVGCQTVRVFHFGWNPFRDWNRLMPVSIYFFESFHFGWNPFRDWNIFNSTPNGRSGLVPLWLKPF